MDFGLSEEQQAIFEMAHAFGQEHIAPFARDWERQGTIPRNCGPRWPSWAWAGSTYPKSMAARA